MNAHLSDQIIQYALKNNCSRQVYDLLFEAYPNSVNILLNLCVFCVKPLFFSIIEFMRIFFI